MYPHVTQFEARAFEDERRAQLRAEIHAARTLRPRRRPATASLLAQVRAALTQAPATPCADEP